MSKPLKIPDFLGGLNFAVDEENLKVNETQNAQNVDISDGNLSVFPGTSKYITVQLVGIVTLMKFFKTNLTTGEITSYILAATSNSIYKWNPDTSVWDLLKSGLSSGDFSFVNYQENDTEILIIGNGKDNMMKFDGISITDLIGSPPKAKSVGLHHERIWLTGDVANPNRLYYSDDFAPENWTYAVDAAGQIDLPTWDGGRIIGLSLVFNDLVVYKTKNIFRVYGTYPGQYEMIQIHANTGAIAPKTVVSSQDQAFHLAQEGLYVYNGVKASPCQGNKINKFLNINKNYVQNACSIIYMNKLYMAYPEGTSTVNNAVLIYDLINNNFMILRGFEVSTWLEYGNKLLFSNNAGYVYQFTGTTFDGTAISSFYETPWSDLGSKNTIKDLDCIEFTAKGSGSLKITVYADSKNRTKTIVLDNTFKVYRVPFNIYGKRLKFRFENITGSTFIIKSPEIYMDIDEE